MTYRRYVIRRSRINSMYPSMPTMWYYRKTRTKEWGLLDDPNLALYSEGTTVSFKPEPGYTYEMIPVDVSTQRKVVRV